LQIYTTDVLVHCAGMHSSRTREIYLTTFLVDSSHALEHQYTRIYEAEGSVNIMGIQTPATEDPEAIWDIYVFYVEYTISNRGKVLATNMERSREIQVFYFQADQDPIDYLKQSITVSKFMYLGDSEYYMFGGRANYVRGYGDEITQSFSWMDTKRVFGFFNVWTTDLACYNGQDRA
jgi:uncharacterized protein (DUF427 family)